MEINKRTTVFVSYASEDLTTAKVLNNDLKKARLATWFDEESLYGGELWKNKITDGIRSCDFFLALLSQHSVEKTGYVHKELKEALDMLDQMPESKVFIIPVRLDDCRPSHNKLNELQWIDLFPLPGEDKKEAYEKGKNKILSSIRKYTATSYPPTLQDELISILERAINNMLRERIKHEGNWGDVRCSSLALWALDDSLLRRESVHPSLGPLQTQLTNINKWIYDQARDEEGGVSLSWESEAWDTSLAIISLSLDEAFKDRIGLASKWLLMDVRDEETGVWYDEVWESTLCTVALLRSGNMLMGSSDTTKWTWIEKVMKWLLAIPPKPSGEFVCPHYSGFLVWLLGEIQNSRVTKQILKSNSFGEFRPLAERSLTWILDFLKNNGDNLWSFYTFSNSYIIIGLSSLGHPLPPNALQRIVHWYKEKQGIGGGFEDIEDTALAVLALSYVGKQLGIVGNWEWDAKSQTVKWY